MVFHRSSGHCACQSGVRRRLGALALTGRRLARSLGPAVHRIFVTLSAMPKEASSIFPSCSALPACLSSYRPPFTGRSIFLGLEDETSTDLVGDGGVFCRGELGGVEREAEGGLDARSECLGVAETEETEIVDFCLDKGCVVKVGLCANFEVNISIYRLGVVGCSCARLDVSIYTVVVGRRVGGKISESVKRDSVLWSMVSCGEVVPRDLASLYVVGCLCTGKEAVTTDDCVCGEGGSLEEVEVLSGVDAGLLVGGGENGVL